MWGKILGNRFQLVTTLGSCCEKKILGYRFQVVTTIRGNPGRSILDWLLPKREVSQEKFWAIDPNLSLPWGIPMIGKYWVIDPKLVTVIRRLPWEGNFGISILTCHYSRRSIMREKSLAICPKIVNYHEGTVMRGNFGRSILNSLLS